LAQFRGDGPRNALKAVDMAWKSICFRGLPFFLETVSEKGLLRQVVGIPGCPGGDQAGDLPQREWDIRVEEERHRSAQSRPAWRRSGEARGGQA
jgi:hypothetical protein